MELSDIYAHWLFRELERAADRVRRLPEVVSVWRDGFRDPRCLIEPATVVPHDLEHVDAIGLDSAPSFDRLYASEGCPKPTPIAILADFRALFVAAAADGWLEMEVV